MPTAIPRYSGKQSGPATNAGSAIAPGSHSRDNTGGTMPRTKRPPASAPRTRKMIGATTNEKKTMPPTIAAIART